MAEIIEEANIGKTIQKVDGKNVVIINNPEINIYQLNEESLEKLPDLFFIKEIPVIRNDITAEVAFNIHNLNVLKDIRPCLEGKDYGAFSYASYVIKLEDKGEAAKDHLKKLFEAYGPRGMRIYSLLRSNILEEEISRMRKEKVSELEMTDQIKKLIEEPNAIFVSFLMDKEILKEEIEKRLSKNIKSFPIYARASRIEIAQESVEEMIQKRDDIALKIESYQLGSTNAITIYIYKLS